MQNNESLLQLKAFSKSLLSIRRGVSAECLIKMLEEGKINCEEVDNENDKDYAFCEDVKTVVSYIKRIVEEPKITLKSENVIKNIVNATRIDGEALRMTIKDGQLWNEKENGNFEPQFVYSKTNETTVEIYENAFISFLIDKLLYSINSKLKEKLGSLKTLNGEIKGYSNKNIDVNFLEYLNLIDNQNGDLINLTDDSFTTSVITSLSKSQKYLMAFRDSELYKKCHKIHNFDDGKITVTNILEHEPRYNYCYRYFVTYYNNNYSIATENTAYVNYVTVNLFATLNSLGFIPNEENEKVYSTSYGGLLFNDLSFTKAPFVVTLNTNDNGLLLDIENTDSNEKANYFIKITESSEKDKVSKFDGIDKYLQSFDYGYTDVLLVSNIEEIDCPSVAKVIINDNNIKEELSKIIKTTTLLARGIFALHSKYCPVCGSSMVYSDNANFECKQCDSKYFIYTKEDNDIIWFKKLPKQYNSLIIDQPKEVDQPPIEQPKSKVVKEKEQEVLNETTNDEVKVSEEIAVTENESVFKRKKYIPKSFKQKIKLISSDRYDYYVEVRDYLLSKEKVRSVVSFSYNNFIFGRSSIAKLVIKGKMLSILVALDYKDYKDSKYFPKDMSDVKRYQATPMLMKVKSKRGVTFAKELIDLAYDRALEIKSRKV